MLKSYFEIKNEKTLAINIVYTPNFEVKASL